MLQCKQVSHTEIVDAIGSGATVITANKRLAGVTRQLFEQANIEKGLQVWLTPQILPWAAWLQTTWEEALVSGAITEPGLLLTPQQELCLWESIITKALSDNPLLQVSGTARQAQQAWQLMQSWQIPLDDSFYYNTDSAEFKQWASAFESHCQQQNWLTAARLPDVLLSEALNSGTKIAASAIADELILFGFDELTPQQQSFLSDLMASGYKISWLQLAGLQSNTVRLACSDSRDEAAIAARWVRRCIEEHPDVSIGIVAPELQSQRNVVVQAFDKVLLPQSLNPAEENVNRPYNVSLGQSLSSYPIIDTALRLLGLLAPTISLQEAGLLLRSPFIRGWQNEASARSLLDACLLKKVGELNISLKTIRVYADQKDSVYSCAELVKNIDAWNTVAEGNKREMNAGQWSESFSSLLMAFGWASGRPLSSEEYQATEAWRDLLLSFASLDVVSGKMTASAAVSQLRSLANDRSYQPQTDSLPIQILGVLEAEEIQFDYLWIMGLHDGVWPSPPHANPFIPLLIQREKNLPHSSEDRELQAVRRSTERLLHSAAEVIVSHPKRAGDNELRVSSLVQNITEIEATSLSLYQAASWSEQIHQSIKLECLESDPAPAITTELVKGGSSILKHQANCPFRAFAELRLGARALDKAGIGLSAMVKGSLIHSILENVWGKLETQEHLLAMEASNLQALVETITKDAIAAVSYRYPQTFTERFTKIESERLCLRVLQWLELEKQRQPFKVIAREEERYEDITDGVQIKVIIDRVDELEDGSKLVIDYKTGSVAPGQWFGDRPEEPQLPLYSMVTEGEISAVAFAQVKAGDMAFKGIAEEEGLLPGVKSFEKMRYTSKETWQEVLAEWKQTMKKLADAYGRGDAAIDPSKPNTCESTYCNLKSLCRINELTTLDEAPAEMEESL